MIREASIDGHELYRDPDTGKWYLRLPCEGVTYGTVHSLHKRVPIGHYRTRDSAERAARQYLQRKTTCQK